MSALKKLKKVFFIGIKGVGMTSLAVYLCQKGIKVTGSDVDEVFQTDQTLKKYHIKVKTDFSPVNVHKDADLVIVTGAHGSLYNPQAQEAVRLGIKTLPLGRALGEFMSGHITISVAGCHGKTTATAMLATIFQEAGIDASYTIGASSISSLPSSGHFGKSPYFIAEADEYITAPAIDPTPRFLWHNPRVGVITNIEYDHPDAYQNINDLLNAYQKFAEKIPPSGLLILCIDDPNNRILKDRLSTHIPVKTYGFSNNADIKIQNYRLENGNAKFSLYSSDKKIGDFSLRIPGRHNVLNAAAAYLASDFFHIKSQAIQKGLSGYQGARRRFELVKKIGDNLFYDDYAHHPTEIKKTLQSIKELYPPRRIISIFQPHTFSRTKSLFQDFVSVFGAVLDPVIITDIFASKREKDNQNISSEDLVAEAIKQGKSDIYYLSAKDEIIRFIKKNISSQDIILTMGAGDIYKLHDDFKSDNLQ